jgi:hypothetical protein
LSDHSGIKLELNDETNNRKHSKPWRLSLLLHDQWVIKEIREEIKKFLEFNENES